MKKIIKELFIGNKIFLVNRECGQTIEKVSRKSEDIMVDIGYREPLIYNTKTNEFSFNREHIEVMFSEKKHRSQYLLGRISKLKKDNESLNKKILENWEDIRKYHSEYLKNGN